MAALVSVSRGPFWRRGCLLPAPVSLDGDGCYRFLAPFLDDLALRTGRRVDLQGDCRFTGAHIAEFRVVIAQALAMARAKPPTFEIDGSDEETLTTVDRGLLIALLNSLDHLAEIAQSEHRAVVCEGEYTLRRRGILTDGQKTLRRRAADAAEQLLKGQLSWSQFNEEFGLDDDPLIEELISLIEHEPKRGGSLSEREWEAHQHALRGTIASIRRSIEA